MWPEVTVARPMLHVDEILGTFPGLPPISLAAGSLISPAGLLGGLLGCVIPKTGSTWAHKEGFHLGGGNRLPSRAFREAVPLCILALFVCSPHRGLLPLEGNLLLRGAFSWGKEGQHRGFPTVSTHLDVALLERRGQVFPEERGCPVSAFPSHIPPGW